VDDQTLALRLMLAAGLTVAGLGALTALLLSAVARTSRDPLFPPAGPVRPVNGAAVVGAFAVFVLVGSAVQTALAGSGFFQRVYGPDFPGSWPEAAAHTVRALWAATFAFPVQVGLIVGLAVALGGNPLTGRGWARNVLAGYLTWLPVTPVAFLVFVLANLVHTQLTGQPPDKHPLTALGEMAGKREWALFVLQTVVLAPALEELVFRGLLLPWLARRRPLPDPEAIGTVPPAWRPLAVLLLSVVVAVLFQAADVQRAWLAGDHRGVVAHLSPGLFFGAVVLLYFVPMDRLRRHLRVRSRQHARAVLASAALFAAFHAHVWPSPVPLLVLAVGLGYLYLRTRSLVGPVVVHGLFNAVSAVYLLLGGKA
jgi:membrane protease YdiL (CAAX protease family)